MILTVHDELVFEVPEDDGDGDRRTRPRRHGTRLPLNVPLTVDVGIGPNWTAAKE